MREFLPITWAGVLCVMLTEQASAQGKPAVGQPAGPEMTKLVSEQGNFVVYLPKGWKARESAQGGVRTLYVLDASGSYSGAVLTGLNPAGSSAKELAGLFVGRIGGTFPDLRLGKAMGSRDGSRVMFEGVFTGPNGARRQFRGWVSGKGQEFLCQMIEGPEGKLEEMKGLLLTTLANVRVVKGSFEGGQVNRVPLVERRLGGRLGDVQAAAGLGDRRLGQGVVHGG